MRWIAGQLVKWLTKHEVNKEQYFCDFDRIKNEIRPCDVLLIEGGNLIARVIQQVTLSPWSHAALYLGRPSDIKNSALKEKILSLPWVEPNTQILIEGYIGQGTVLNPLEYYRSYNIRICRPRGLLRSDATAVIEASLAQLGTPYDLMQVLDLARFLLPWSFIPKRWRSSLFYYKAGLQTKTVCSTMIASAFDHVKFPILPLIRVNRYGTIELYQRNPKLYTPKDFDYSPYFEIIKFPYVTNYEMHSYRKLPWNKDGFIANDLEIFNPNDPETLHKGHNKTSLMIESLRNLAKPTLKWLGYSSQDEANPQQDKNDIKK
ncbi:hypothetical protein EBR43_01960 [bacterium]|jgi:hypothetical protein|nr:hypothetical protein [bacterium]NBX72488.1 hypothetical protein [bacterium]